MKRMYVEVDPSFSFPGTARKAQRRYAPPHRHADSLSLCYCVSFYVTLPISICLSTTPHLCFRESLSIALDVYVSAFTAACLSLYPWLFGCIYLCVCVCIYIYIYMYVYIYIYIYIFLSIGLYLYVSLPVCIFLYLLFIVCVYVRVYSCLPQLLYFRLYRGRGRRRGRKGRRRTKRTKKRPKEED